MADVAAAAVAGSPGPGADGDGDGAETSGGVAAEAHEALQGQHDHRSGHLDDTPAGDGGDYAGAVTGGAPAGTALSVSVASRLAEQSTLRASGRDAREATSATGESRRGVAATVWGEWASRCRRDRRRLGGASDERAAAASVVGSPRPRHRLFGRGAPGRETHDPRSRPPALREPRSTIITPHPATTQPSREPRPTIITPHPATTQPSANQDPPSSPHTPRPPSPPRTKTHHHHPTPRDHPALREPRPIIITPHICDVPASPKRHSFSQVRAFSLVGRGALFARFSRDLCALSMIVMSSRGVYSRRFAVSVRRRADLLL